jgi:hypothetical protein
VRGITAFNFLSEYFGVFLSGALAPSKYLVISSLSSLAQVCGESELLATSGDFLRLWRFADDTTQLHCVLSNVCIQGSLLQPQHCST